MSMNKILTSNSLIITLGLLAILAGLISFSTQPGSLSISIPDNVNAGNRQIIAAAGERLTSICPGLADYQKDLTQGDIGIASALDYQQQQWQWTGYVEFNFKVSDDPIFIPASFRAAGHNCYYRVGIDGAHAVDSPKQECRQICSGK